MFINHWLGCCRLRVKSASGRPIGGKSGRKWLPVRAMMDMMTRSSIPSTKCWLPSDPCSRPAFPASLLQRDTVTSSRLQPTSIIPFCFPMNNVFVFSLINVQFHFNVHFLIIIVIYQWSVYRVQNLFTPFLHHRLPPKILLECTARFYCGEITLMHPES